MLTDSEIQKFIDITYQIKGVKLSKEKALVQGLKLLELFDFLALKEQNIGVENNGK